MIEWCVKVTIHMAPEGHKLWRLWFLPPALIKVMEQWDYSGRFGSSAMNEEVHNLLRIVNTIEWDFVSFHNCSRDPVNPRPCLSPGRHHTTAGDYVWFNPSTGQRCTNEEAERGRTPCHSRRGRSLAYRDLNATPSFPSYQSSRATAGTSTPNTAQPEREMETTLVEKPLSEGNASPPPVQDEEVQEIEPLTVPVEPNAPPPWGVPFVT